MTGDGQCLVGSAGGMGGTQPAESSEHPALAQWTGELSDPGDPASFLRHFPPLASGHSHSSWIILSHELLFSYFLCCFLIGNRNLDSGLLDSLEEK